MPGSAAPRPCWFRVSVGVAVLVSIGTAAPLAAQEKKTELDPKTPSKQEPFGRIVHEIIIEPSTVNRGQVLNLLKMKEGAKLTKANHDEDLTNLYEVLRYRTRTFFRPLENNQVDLFLVLTAPKYYDRVQFKGMTHLTESEVRVLTGISRAQRVTEDEVELLRLLLRDRYRRDGFYFVNIDKRPDDEKRIMTFLIDEGPRVRVRSLKFRGNKSFPGDVFLGYGQNLQGSAKLESVPGVFYGEPFSVFKMEDDIEKVELFYRRNGYLNAEVHLEAMNPSQDRTEVDLTFRVDEGERFKVVEVDVEFVDTETPLYSKEEVLKEIKLEPGDYYSSVHVNRDRRALEDFYGKRGHPTVARYGRTLGNLFRVPEPFQTVVAGRPEVKLTYRIIEGKPKTLREVRIHGNTTTRDRVIRRLVLLLPGDILDVTKLNRSQQLLDRTRYFQNPQTLSGVSFRLNPVDGSEQEVDLDIYVKEGETGSFTWGAGVSTGTGVRGNFQFVKRNFDLTRLPSSWNPAVWFSEIADGKAFHGGGQSLDLLLAPGTEVSLFRVSWFEPDLFKQHMDTIGLRVDGYKTIRILDTYNTDRLGAGITLSRIFDETTRVNLSVRDETVEVDRIDPNAPLIVFQNEGQTEIRALRLSLALADLDNPLHPRQGYNFNTYGEVAGGPFGASENFYKVGTSLEVYRPFHVDALDRKHVIYSKLRFDYADTFGSTPDLFPSERFFMGGSNLRGFDQRRAGPAQFDEPVGGTAMLLSTLEYQFPLVSTQMEGTTRHTEIIRGVVFMDFGLLGLDIDDPTFREPRLTVGFGIRIQVPVLQVPIQLDLAWPILAEATDREEQLFFSFRRF